MAATSTLTLRVKSIGERSIDGITRRLAKLQAATMAYSSVSTRSLQATDVKWKKHFDGVDKGIKMFGGALTKFVTMSAKFAAVQVGALGIAMMAVHASFVLGNAAIKAFQFLATGAAGAAAGLAAAASIAAAAVREQQIAMYSYKGGNNYQNASVAMRALAADADLATVGAANLNAVFAEVSKTSTFSAGSQNLLKGLMDFASAGKPLEEGAKSAGKLIAAMQDPKGSFSKMKEAAKELGPEMEKAITGLGITSADELKKAIMDGTLSAAGGVDGQFARVNDTLISRFKSSFALIKNDFADFGDPLLAPTKKMFEGIVKIFNNTFRRVAGDIAAFANGSMFGDMEGVIGRMADFFVNFIRDYLPKVQGMFGSLGGWWDRFKEGWNMVLDKLRPLIEGAKVFEETLMRVLRPIGASLSEAFGGFNEQVVANADKFYEFGDAIGKFVVVMSKYASSVRDVFMDALPFITKIVNGLTGIVDLFMSLMGGFRSLFGGSSMGSFMLLATMLSGGRAAKKTTGGFVSSYKLKDVTAKSGDLLTGQTARGNVTEGGKARAGRLGAAISSQSVRSMTVSRMIVRSTGGAMGKDDPRVQAQLARSQAKRDEMSTRSAQTSGQQLQKQQAAIAQREALAKADKARTDAQARYDAATTGKERRQAARALRQADRASLQARQGTVSLPQLGMGPATYANNRFTRTFRMTAEQRAEMLEQHRAATGMAPGVFTKTRAGMQKVRQARESYGYKRMFGGDIGTKDNPRVVKGINNTMGASLGAGVALGIASKLAPESAQGALALGSAVAMVNPLAGLAVGVVGGLVMGIRGATAKRKKEATAEATRVAKDFASSTMDAFRDGISSAIETGTFTKNTIKEQRAKGARKFSDKSAEIDQLLAGTLNKRGQFSMSLGSGNTGFSNDVETGFSRGTVNEVTGASTIRELAALDAAGQDMFNADKLKAAAKQQRLMGTGIFGKMSDSQYEEAMKDPEAFATSLAKMTADNEKAFSMITDFGDERIAHLSTVFNKPTEEILKLADAIGLDLFNHTEATTEQIKKLGTAMIDTKREMEIAAQDRFASGTNIFSIEKKAIEGREALDEGAFALRGQFNEGALDKKTALTFAENTREQLIAYFKGDVGLAEATFNEQYGVGGLAYTQVGGALEGMGDAMALLIGEELNAATEQSRLGRAANANELITANAMKDGMTVGGDLAGLSTALADNPMVMAGVTSILESVDLNTEMGQTELLTFLQASGLGDFGLKFETYVEPQMAAADALRQAGVDLQAAAAALVAPAADTRTPRGAIGDATSRNLGATLSNHSAVNGSIPGKRNITSGYRNYALGSLKSDHVTGRALDMVGDNLVSYRDKMTAAGGLAEFHGKGDTRHLHVVPPSRSLGDSMTAVSAVSSNIAAVDGAQTVSNSNNFYITGADPQEIANAVMAKMAMINKSNGERR